jgi:hypothetical protein
MSAVLTPQQRRDVAAVEKGIRDLEMGIRLRALERGFAYAEAAEEVSSLQRQGVTIKDPVALRQQLAGMPGPARKAAVRDGLARYQKANTPPTAAQVTRMAAYAESRDLDLEDEQDWNRAQKAVRNGWTPDADLPIAPANQMPGHAAQRVSYEQTESPVTYEETPSPIALQGRRPRSEVGPDKVDVVVRYAEEHDLDLDDTGHWEEACHAVRGGWTPGEQSPLAPD